VLFKLVLYTDKVIFNAESIRGVVLPTTSFNIRWL